MKICLRLIMCFWASNIAFALTPTAYSATLPNEQAYVDLGLPSGTLWATCNIGANTPEEYGNYFAWGETKPKTNYSWTNYKYCNKSQRKLTKYCNDKSYGSNSYTDSYSSILAEDDIASINLGNSWRMPTKEEFEELKKTCTWSFTTQKGVNGYKVMGTNGNSIFLPAAGYISESKLSYNGTEGYYWSSSLRGSNPSNAYYLCLKNGYYDYLDGWRCYGRSLRPVSTTTAKPTNTQTTSSNHANNNNTTTQKPSTKPNASQSTTNTTDRIIEETKAHDFVNLGLSVAWATCNIGAKSPEEFGYFIAWGETQTKKEYTWDNYKHGKVGDFTKYLNKSDNLYGQKVDGKIVLDLEDDAARINWGGYWRMPTKAEIEELLYECNWEWTTLNGVEGYKVTGRNGFNTSIFLPAVAPDDPTPLEIHYWSSTLNPNDPITAYTLMLECYDMPSLIGNYRYTSNTISNQILRRTACTIRPVFNSSPAANKPAKPIEYNNGVHSPQKHLAKTIRSYNSLAIDEVTTFTWNGNSLEKNKPPHKSEIYLMYDNNNRIDKIKHSESITDTYTYSDNRLLKINRTPRSATIYNPINSKQINCNINVEIKFTYSNNKISEIVYTEETDINPNLKKQILAYDPDYETKFHNEYRYKLFWDGNNIKELIYDSGNNATTYTLVFTYDEYPNPLYGLHQPISLPNNVTELRDFSLFFSKNNPTTMVYTIRQRTGTTTRSENYTYKYDKDGYPLKRGELFEFIYEK